MCSVLFKIFGIPIRSYGLMMVIGFVIGLRRAIRASQRYKIEASWISDLALIVLLSGIAGARIVFIALNLNTESFREFFAVWNGGLSFHGALIFGVLAALIYTRIRKLSFLQCADLLSPSVAIGYAFARIGCFMNGCCYGAPTSLPWAIRFRENGILTPPSHPTQIYSALASILIFLILTRIEKFSAESEHQKANVGLVFISYLGLYSIYRFLIEFLRKGYSAQVWLVGITQAQWVSLLTIAACGIILLLRYRKPGVRGD